MTYQRYFIRQKGDQVPPLVLKEQIRWRFIVFSIILEFSVLSCTSPFDKTALLVPPHTYGIAPPNALSPERTLLSVYPRGTPELSALKSLNMRSWVSACAAFLPNK